MIQLNDFDSFCIIIIYNSVTLCLLTANWKRLLVIEISYLYSRVLLYSRIHRVSLNCMINTYVEVVRVQRYFLSLSVFSHSNYGDSTTYLYLHFSENSRYNYDLLDVTESTSIYRFTQQYFPHNVSCYW